MIIEREDKVRHYMEDNDTLNFNNDRLSKRISALQEQLQEVLACKFNLLDSEKCIKPWIFWKESSTKER